MNQTIENFYSAFANYDVEKMVSYYHDDVEFTDPAFGTLKGERAKNMWRMLCQNPEDSKLKISFSNINAANGKVTATWEGKYVFSKTGKKVHNIINAEFEFKDGKIIKHTDSFNLHKWAKQALGTSGFLLGKTSFFKKKLNAQTNKALSIFENNR
jgi:ketosteroid isomerase-like protein